MFLMISLNLQKIMAIRKVDSNNDWIFGYNSADYANGNDEIAQNISTRLQEWKNNCFWNVSAGINYSVRLVYEDQERLLLQDVKNVISQTNGVSAILSVNVSLQSRKLTIDYKVLSIYKSIIENTKSFRVPIS